MKSKSKIGKIYNYFKLSSRLSEFYVVIGEVRTEIFDDVIVLWSDGIVSSFSTDRAGDNTDVEM